MILFSHVGLSTLRSQNHLSSSSSLLFRKLLKRLYVWLKRPEETHIRKTGPKRNWKLNLEKLKQLTQEKPDAYHFEYAEVLNVSTSAVQKGLHQLKITRKKNVYVPRKK